MSQFSKIFAASAVCGLISSVVAVISAAIFIVIFIKHMGIFSSGSDYSMPEILMSIVCLIVLFLSFVSCPYLAYSLRQSVFEVAGSVLLQAILFFMIGSSQIIFLALGYVFLLPSLDRIINTPTKPPTTAAQDREERFLKQIRDANINVTVKNARIVYRDSVNVIAEIALEIENVPQEISEYSVDVIQINQNNNFYIGTRNFTGQAARYTGLDVVSKNGKWMFYSQPGAELISENSNNAALPITFCRNDVMSKELPQTITPRLRANLYEGEKPAFQAEIFNRPIPINFENF